MAIQRRRSPGWRPVPGGNHARPGHQRCAAGQCRRLLGGRGEYRRGRDQRRGQSHCHRARRVCHPASGHRRLVAWGWDCRRYHRDQRRYFGGRRYRHGSRPERIGVQLRRHQRICEHSGLAGPAANQPHPGSLGPLHRAGFARESLGWPAVHRVQAKHPAKLFRGIRPNQDAGVWPRLSSISR